MSTNDGLLGRVQSNWRRRSTEKTTFAHELRIIPSWLVTLVLFLYGLGLAIATYISVAYPRLVLDPLMDETTPIRVLGMAGIVTAVAIPGGAIILLLGYVSRDAKRRGMSPVLWTLVALLVPYLLGAITYFLVREPLPVPCPQCGRMTSPRFNFCPSCQYNLRPNCPQCRREISPDDRFCPYCAFALAASAAAEKQRDSAEIAR